ncbi:MAG: hypothetical protein SGI84_01065 [Gemmatimonadota bacterium]|nr:hypothetical protein [Gemmatimonadota bacterium]
MIFSSRTILLAATGAALLAVEAGAQEPRARDTLFSVERPLEVTLRADWREVFRHRDPDKEVKVPGSLLVTNGSRIDTIPVSFHTRGNFRLKPSTCSIPPVMIVFDQGSKSGTPFAGQDELKLVTHCRDNERYEQNNHLEYLTYRMYNLLTDRSFGARRLVATWEDTVRAERSVKPAFLLEEDGMLAERLGGKLDKAPVGFDESDPVNTTLMGLFLLMIGNTDWSQPGQHNVKMVRTDSIGNFLPVPYDFDWSGMINAPYARPDASLGIRTVRDRLYRGPCVDATTFQVALRVLTDKREAILALVNGHADLAESRRKDAVEYLQGFFKDAGEYETLRRRYLDRCG